MANASKPKLRSMERERKARPSVPVLCDETRAFIVANLACYQPVSHVQREVLERFGHDVSHQAITRYNPEHALRHRLAAKRVTLFYATREKLLDELADEPVAGLGIRPR